MTFCAQMWDLLGEQAVAKLKSGPNRLRDWGPAWLLREKQTKRKANNCAWDVNSDRWIFGIYGRLQ